jgi:hypothetical protein
MDFFIKDDAHYAKSLDWLTDKAEEIARGDAERNPLKRASWKDERARLMINYNMVSDALRMYSQPESCHPIRR